MVRKNPFRIITPKNKKWKRNERIQAGCLYCHTSFPQDMPWQKYCCQSHRQLAYMERHAKDKVIEQDNSS